MQKIVYFTSKLDMQHQKQSNKFEINMVTLWNLSVTFVPSYLNDCSIYYIAFNFHILPDIFDVSDIYAHFSIGKAFMQT